ncbi:hypothetical protein M422DRAFT_36889 [Sphaerobolus stellatus SS14]|uniref:Uncharacterized protein n=1 Tax=Sphaerobolus stellatus (strain SS14) TaxID=990650 RepID=A0A0C9U5W4_SPHS4|nr:hypothetical protein M422DRAFT_36889 [Sphaerobolus stellatus SS14]
MSFSAPWSVSLREDERVKAATEIAMAEMTPSTKEVVDNMRAQIRDIVERRSTWDNVY